MPLLSPFVADSDSGSELQPRQVKYAKMPDYFSEFKDKGGELGCYLGSCILAKILISDLQSKMFVVSCPWGEWRRGALGPADRTRGEVAWALDADSGFICLCSRSRSTRPRGRRLIACWICCRAAEERATEGMLACNTAVVLINSVSSTVHAATGQPGCWIGNSRLRSTTSTWRPGPK